MSETLLAILLVTSSAKGSSLVCRWPPSPQPSARLVRPRPTHDVTCAHGDNPWRAANAPDGAMEENPPCVCPDIESSVEEDYVWRRPTIAKERSLSLSHSRSHPSSRRASPSKESHDDYIDGARDTTASDEYESVLGYNAEFLAGMLCPQSTMCHQKFELLVDDLAFIGHPVCAEPDGLWRFKTDKVKMAPRGRVSRRGESQQAAEKSLTPDFQSGRSPLPPSTWLQTFHFVLVLDRPDPSSSAIGTLWKYFDIIYEQVAFTVAAVLYQEQVLHNWVETECEALGASKDDFVSRGEPYTSWMNEALKLSNLASAMKTLYEAIRDDQIAHLTLHGIPLELQLPSSLRSLIHGDEDVEVEDADEDDEFGVSGGLSTEISFANKMPVLAPWKALLRLDDDDERGYELYMRLRAPQLAMEDRDLAEQLIRFLNLASATLSLSDMAQLLDWDLEAQVYPTVRWLLHHRRAKLVDTVHHSLKTVFAVSQKLSVPLSQLSADFADKFVNTSVPSLPKLLSTISASEHTPGPNHFFATVVHDRDAIPLYHDVVAWLLKRGLLVTLHLRVRIVTTEPLKERVRVEWDLQRARRARERARSGAGEKGELGVVPESSPVAWFSLSPKSARRISRGVAGSLSMTSAAEAGTEERSRSRRRDPDTREKLGDGEEDEELLSSGTEDMKWEDWFRGEGEDVRASIISDPARATPLQRRWLEAMSEGKEAHIARRFEQINQYFDGKCTDDEILYRAEISRKQLREVLHHYEDYLQTLLHPS